MAGSGGRHRPTVDDVRTAYYRQAPQQAWVREVHLDPLELIVSDDADGTTKRVPVTVSASGEITFGQPRRVRVEYTPVDDTQLDKSALVYASAADSRAGHGTHVYTYSSSRREPAAMPQPQRSNHPGDRPRQPTEDPVSWALATGRIGPERQEFWRRQVAASAQAATNVLETLAPGCAVPLTAAGRLHTVTASVPSRPAGADPRLYARNPLVDDLRKLPGSSVYAEAAQYGGTEPTLFPEGDLPHATSAGISPATLAALPWYGRHPVAAAATTAEAEDLIDDLSSPGHLVEEYRDHPGNRDYQLRVRSWSMRGIEAAAAQRQVVDAQAAWQSDQQVAAAVEGMTEEEREGLLFDDGPGRAHLESLRSIASGRAVGSGLTQTQARMQLEQFAHGQGPSGRFGQVSASAAQAELDRLDKELGRAAAAQQVAAAAAEREGRR